MYLYLHVHLYTYTFIHIHVFEFCRHHIMISVSESSTGSIQVHPPTSTNRSLIEADSIIETELPVNGYSTGSIQVLPPTSTYQNLCHLHNGNDLRISKGTESLVEADNIIETELPVNGYSKANIQVVPLKSTETPFPSSSDQDLYSLLNNHDTVYSQSIKNSYESKINDKAALTSMPQSCRFVYVYIYVYVYINIFVYMHIHINISKYIHTYIYTYIVSTLTGCPPEH
jgi:hypothetical protein